MKLGMTPEEKQVLVSEILSYLLKHPEASDTLEGIARFWFVRRQVDLILRDVEEAVGELVAKGILEERVAQTPAGSVTKSNYRLNPGRRRDIEKLLNKYKPK